MFQVQKRLNSIMPNISVRNADMTIVASTAPSSERIGHYRAWRVPPSLVPGHRRRAERRRERGKARIGEHRREVLGRADGEVLEKARIGQSGCRIGFSRTRIRISRPRTGGRRPGGRPLSTQVQTTETVGVAAGEKLVKLVTVLFVFVQLGASPGVALAYSAPARVAASRVACRFAKSP